MIKNKLICGKQGCEYFLATESSDGALSIKHRDLYIAFEGGILRVTCPQCGTRNFICTEEYSELHPDRVNNMTAPHDVVNAIYKEWIPRNKFNKKENAK